MGKPTLNEVLAKLGLTHLASGRGYEHNIYDADKKVIFRGSAGDVWKWLRETGRIK